MLLNRPTRNWLESNSPSLHQTQGESLLMPVAFYVHGPNDRPASEQCSWMARVDGVLADPETPADLTRLAEQAFWRWVEAGG